MSDITERLIDQVLEIPKNTKEANEPVHSNPQGVKIKSKRAAKSKKKK